MEINREVKLVVTWQPEDIQTLSNMLEIVRCSTHPLYDMAGQYTAAFGLSKEEITAAVRLAQKLQNSL